jgi:isopentenyl diphosphate isomerase/L-lactate dehydrogenase-like FMN-dependent dehydrogenase
MQAMAHPDGERAASRACASRGVPYCAAQQATTSVERIARGGGGARMWFQLYVRRDRAATAALARRAARAGATAIVVTVDAPTLGRRERDVRNGFTMRDGLTLANVDHRGGGGDGDDDDDSEAVDASASAAQKRISKRVGDRDAGLTWSSLIPWLKSIVPTLPIILKGVMTREDAAAAVAHGVDGVWVSNHGGRQLDGAPSTLRALAEVVAGVNDDARGGGTARGSGRTVVNAVPVVFDGGVRRGSDVLKALALGADVVAIGRPVAWGLACGGEAGVRKAIDVLTEELESSMRLAGVTSARDAREKGIARAAWTSPRAAATSKL